MVRGLPGKALLGSGLTGDLGELVRRIHYEKNSERRPGATSSAAELERAVPQSR